MITFCKSSELQINTAAAAIWELHSNPCCLETTNIFLYRSNAAGIWNEISSKYWGKYKNENKIIQLLLSWCCITLAATCQLWRWKWWWDLILRIKEISDKYLSGQLVVAFDRNTSRTRCANCICGFVAKWYNHTEEVRCKPFLICTGVVFFWKCRIFFRIKGGGESRLIWKIYPLLYGNRP